MASTKVEIRDNRGLRRVEAINADGEVAGFAMYQISVDGTTFDFNHTEVDERFAGQGIGGQLAAGVMEFARSEGITIQPTCSFIESYMDEHEETNDLRAADPSEESEESEESDEDSGDDQAHAQSDDRSEDRADEESGDQGDADGDDDRDRDQAGDKDESQDDHTDDDGSDEDTDEDSDDESADEDSPDAGPADAKAAGSGGATEEEDSRA